MPVTSIRRLSNIAALTLNDRAAGRQRIKTSLDYVCLLPNLLCRDEGLQP